MIRAVDGKGEIRMQFAILFFPYVEIFMATAESISKWIFALGGGRSGFCCF